MTRTPANLIDVYPYRFVAAEGGEVEFLLLRRAPGTVYEGEWRMVGGKIKVGETAAVAALREVVEETGIKPRTMWAIPATNTFYDRDTNRIMTAVPFAARLDGDVRLNHEHDAYEWLTVPRALARLVWPEQRRLLSLVNEELERGVSVSWRVPIDTGR